MQTDIERNKDSNKLALFALFVAPFILNDFANIFIENFRVWLAIDYLSVKAFPLVLIVHLLRTKKIALSDLGLKMIAPSQLVLWTIVMAVIGTAIDQVGWRFFENVLPSTKLGGIPRIPPPWLDRVDLYFGLICVGIFEEVIFLGLHAIVNTAIIGAVFMVVMWRTGSVVPTIISHFIVNYVSFSGMIPYNSPWFDLLK